MDKINQENNELLVDTRNIVLCAYETGDGVVAFGYFRCEYFRDHNNLIQLLRGFDNPYTTAIRHNFNGTNGKKYFIFEDINYIDKNGNEVRLVPSCELLAVIGTYENLRKGYALFENNYSIGIDSRANMLKLLQRVDDEITWQAKQCGDSCELFTALNKQERDTSQELFHQLERCQYENVKYTLTRTIVTSKN